jgi:hypothetical protein
MPSAHKKGDMNPVFHFIDWMLREHGTFVSGFFVYVAVPFVAWYLGRRAGQKKTKGNHTFILVIRPPMGVPPVIRWEIEPPSDGSGPFG